MPIQHYSHTRCGESTLCTHTSYLFLYSVKYLLHTKNFDMKVVDVNEMRSSPLFLYIDLTFYVSLMY
jgi:hypothetical protein